MNQIVVSGRLSRDPEISVTKSGVPYCRFTVACARPDKTVDWIRVTAWRETAEACAKHLCKGQEVTVNGNLRSSVVANDDGSKTTYWGISAHLVEFGMKPGMLGLWLRAHGMAAEPEPEPEPEPDHEPDPEPEQNAAKKPAARTKAVRSE